MECLRQFVRKSRQIQQVNATALLKPNFFSAMFDRLFWWNLHSGLLFAAEALAGAASAPSPSSSSLASESAALASPSSLGVSSSLDSGSELDLAASPFSSGDAF